jgi:1-acyl-sn-glycerol-3-phosphate acyltransferase
LDDTLSVPGQRIDTLVDLLEWQCEHIPHAMHVRFLDDATVCDLTYADLLRRARAVAGGLQAVGVGAGQTVALMLPSGLDYFGAFFGVLLAGAVPVPIYPPARLTQVEEHFVRHRRILMNAGVVGLITFREIRAVASLLAAKLPELDRIWTVDELERGELAIITPRCRPADTAFLQYTSGSTGDPKGVVLSQGAVMASLRAMGRAAQVTDGDRFVSWLPLYHDMGLIGAWLGSLCHGMPLVLMSPLSFLARPVKWLEAISHHRGTLSGGPNFAFELCARRVGPDELTGLDLSGWRMAFNGAEPVDTGTMQRFSERFCAVGFRQAAFSPVYGLAEATLGVSFTPPDERYRVDVIDRQRLQLSGRAVQSPPSAQSVHLASSGVPIPGFEIRTVDERGRETGERELGAIEFRGPGACSGYYDNEHESAQLMDGDWLRTGDLGYIAGGQLYVTGRSKDLIIRAGRNLSPYEIENAAGAVEGIRTGCVAAFGTIDTREGTEQLVVAAESRQRGAEDRERLAKKVAIAVLEAIGQPLDKVVILAPGAVLKTSSGKIRRVEMAIAYREGQLERGGAGRQAAAVLFDAGKGYLHKAASKTRSTAFALWWWGTLGPLAMLALGVVSVSQSPGTARRRCGLLARAFLAITTGSPKVIGLEHFPVQDAAVVVCNHASYMDGLLLYAALPAGEVPWVVKGELARHALPRRFLGGLGSVFVDRFDAAQSLDQLRQMVEQLRAGQRVGVFPEGTLHRMPGLLSFQLGAFSAAVQADVPIVPIVVRGTRSMLRDGSWFPRSGALEVEILAPISASQLHQGDTSTQFERAVDLRDQCRAVMLQACGEPDLGDRPVLRHLVAALGERSSRSAGLDPDN